MNFKKHFSIKNIELLRLFGIFDAYKIQNIEEFESTVMDNLYHFLRAANFDIDKIDITKLEFSMYFLKGRNENNIIYMLKQYRRLYYNEEYLSLFSFYCYVIFQNYKMNYNTMSIRNILELGYKNVFYSLIMKEFPQNTEMYKSAKILLRMNSNKILSLDFKLVEKLFQIIEAEVVNNGDLFCFYDYNFVDFEFPLINFKHYKYSC